MHKQKQKTQPPFLQDTLEKLYELGTDTAKQAAMATAETFNPISEILTGETEKARQEGKNDFTDINPEKLEKAYEEHDQEEIERLQKMINPQKAEEQEEQQLQMDYHKRREQEEEELNLRAEQEEEEEERQEALLEQQEKQAEEEQRQTQQQEAPKGKKRRNILGGEHQKATSELPPEFRPDAGKQ